MENKLPKNTWSKWKIKNTWSEWKIKNTWDKLNQNGTN